MVSQYIINTGLCCLQQDAGVDNGDATDSEGSDDGGGDDGFSVWLLEGLLEAILLMTVTVSDRLNAV